jgi:hypothetical protein
MSPSRLGNHSHGELELELPPASQVQVEDDELQVKAFKLLD